MILNKKQKYYVIFCKKEHGIFKRLRKKRINAITEKARYKKRTYLLNVVYPTYSKGLKIFYFIDTTKGQLVAENVEIKNRQVLFKGNSKNILINPKTLDKLMSQNIISQLTSNLSDTLMKTSIITLIIGIAIGGPIGYIIAGM